MTLYSRAPEDRNLKVPSALLPSAPSTDHLSLALHALSLSPNLTHLNLGGNVVLSPCFYWPQDLTTSTPYWPHLQYLNVYLNMTTPEGIWRFVRDPEDSDDEDDEDDADEDDADEEDIDPLTLSDFMGLVGFSSTGVENETPLSDSEVFQTLNERFKLLLDGDKPVQMFRKIIDGKRLTPMLRAMTRATRHMPAMLCLGLHLDIDYSKTVGVRFLARAGMIKQ